MVAEGEKAAAKGAAPTPIVFVISLVVVLITATKVVYKMLPSGEMAKPLPIGEGGIIVATTLFVATSTTESVLELLFTT